MKTISAKDINDVRIELDLFAWGKFYDACDELKKSYPIPGVLEPNQEYDITQTYKGSKKLFSQYYKKEHYSEILNEYIKNYSLEKFNAKVNNPQKIRKREVRATWTISSLILWIIFIVLAATTVFCFCWTFLRSGVTQSVTTGLAVGGSIAGIGAIVMLIIAIIRTVKHGLVSVKVIGGKKDLTPVNEKNKISYLRHSLHTDPEFLKHYKEQEEKAYKKLYPKIVQFEKKLHALVEDKKERQKATQFPVEFHKPYIIWSLIEIIHKKRARNVEEAIQIYNSDIKLEEERQNELIKQQQARAKEIEAHNGFVMLNKSIEKSREHMADLGVESAKRNY